MGAKHGEGARGGVGEDETACGYGLGGVGVEAGADCGVDELDGYAVHYVANKKEVAEQIGGVARCVALGIDGKHSAGEYFAGGKGGDAAVISLSNLAGGVGHGLGDEGEFGRGDVELRVGEGCLGIVVEQTAYVVEMAVGHEDGLDIGGAYSERGEAGECEAAARGGETGVEHDVALGGADQEAVHRRGHFAVGSHGVYLGFVGVIFAIVERCGLIGFVGADEGVDLESFAREAEGAFGRIAALAGEDGSGGIGVPVDLGHRDVEIECYRSDCKE